MDFVDKAEILAELWLAFKEDEDFSTFVNYNDIGLPLANAQTYSLVTGTTTLGENYILDTAKMFFDLLEITEAEVDALTDQSLTAIFTYSYEKKNPLTN